MKNNATNILPIVIHILQKDFGGSEKTWKNRITFIKSKYGFVKEQQTKENRGVKWVKK